MQPPLEPSSQRLPFQPESLPAARHRYEETLQPLYNIERIHAGISQRPSTQRKHVFDFKSGLRLIISREVAPLNPKKDRGPFLHLSASFEPGKVQLNSKQVPIGEVVRTFYYISRTPGTLEPIWTNISEHGVLHLLFPDPLEDSTSPADGEQNTDPDV